jgi:peptidylprolyl isomerase domain and WD repeat-containing protein 1
MSEKRKQENESNEEKTSEDNGNGHELSEEKTIDESSDEDLGPKPVSVKKRKTIPFESIYASNLPSSESYERSFMHRDVITHVMVTKTDFVITASIDGHIKFWKKQSIGIEFVKHFRTHLGPITDLCANTTGTLLASISTDKTLKVFDIINFDMIHMIQLEYKPHSTQWCHSSGDAIPMTRLLIINRFM